MPDPEPTRAFEQALRFLLLCLVWGAWLAIRALWELLEWLRSRRVRRALGRALGWAGLAILIALLPKAGGLLWGRMMLQDAAEVAALQSEGLDPREIAAALRRRAFALGFTDILAQEEAIQVAREGTGEGDTCRIGMAFTQRVDLYGWAEIPLRIQLQVEKPVRSRPAEPDLKDLVP